MFRTSCGTSRRRMVWGLPVPDPRTTLRARVSRVETGFPRLGIPDMPLKDFQMRHGVLPLPTPSSGPPFGHSLSTSLTLPKTPHLKRLPRPSSAGLLWRLTPCPRCPACTPQSRRRSEPQLNFRVLHRLLGGTSSLPG